MFSSRLLTSGLLSTVLTTVLGGCGVNEIERTLEPVEHRVQRAHENHGQEGIACGIARWGLGPSRYWQDEDPYESLIWPVGYNHFWHGWAHRERCEHGSSETFAVAVRFDLTELPPIIVSEAELSFTIVDPNRFPQESDRSEDFTEFCPEAGEESGKFSNAVVERVEMVDRSWEAGRHDVETHLNLRAPRPGPLSRPNPLYVRSVAPRSPDKTVDVTEWVMMWMGQRQPDRPNHGISFWGLNYDFLKENRVCTAAIGATLTVRGLGRD